MAYKSLNKSDYSLISQDNEQFLINITTDFTIPSDQSIIVWESATGDGGLTINNGRLQESLPLRGVLLGLTKSDLLQKCSDLTKLKENGEPVDFIHPFTTVRNDKGNKYHIKRIEFEFTKSNQTAIPFTMTLTEYREANVRTTSVNLVNYQSLNLMQQYYFNLVGN